MSNIKGLGSNLIQSYFKKKEKEMQGNIPKKQARKTRPQTDKKHKPKFQNNVKHIKKMIHLERIE